MEKKSRTFSLLKNTRICRDLAGTKLKKPGMRLGRKVCEWQIQVWKHTKEHTKFLGKDAEFFRFILVDETAVLFIVIL